MNTRGLALFHGFIAILSKEKAARSPSGCEGNHQERGGESARPKIRGLFARSLEFCKGGMSSWEEVSSVQLPYMKCN